MSEKGVERLVILILQFFRLSRFLWRVHTHINSTEYIASQKNKFLHGLSVSPSCTLVDKNKGPDRAGLISPATVRKKHTHSHILGPSKNRPNTNKPTLLPYTHTKKKYPLVLSQYLEICSLKRLVSGCQNTRKHTHTHTDRKEHKKGTHTQ